jgi:hypothetical protein
MDPHDSAAMVGVGALIVGGWALLVLLGAGLTALLVRRVWRNWATATRAAKAFSAAAIAAALLGVTGHVFGAVGFMGSVAPNGETSAKARALGEGISLAMNCTALSFMVWTPCIFVAFLLLRNHR